MPSIKFEPYDRIIVLALDSVCWEVLMPLVADGTMPALGAYLIKAHFGVLESTIPPHTAAAWTTWLTGKDPGKHGVIDFVRFDPRKHKFTFNDSTVTRDASIFSLLSNSGISCGSIFLPRNYPPYPLRNGYMISGFETPGVNSKFAEPPEIREEVLNVSPSLHFNFDDDWEDDDGNDDAFARNIERAIETVDLLEQLSVHFQRTNPARLQVAYLQSTDILFHKTWRWCDPKTAGTNPRRRDLIKKFFRRIDSSINRILGMYSTESRRSSGRSSVRLQAVTADVPGASSSAQWVALDPGKEPKTLRLICSDHGHGSSEGRVFINNLLQEWGYLVPLGTLGQLTRRMTMFSLNKDERKVRGKELALDWRRTRAYMAHVGIHGFVYLNLKGREPQGVVDPGDFEKTRDELIAKFRAARIPGTERPLFKQVWKGEELYARKEELDLPDIIVAAADGLYPRKKLTHKKAVGTTPDAVGGVHRQDGVYAFSGDGVLPSGSQGRRANIADIAPTLLAALGQPIPADMTGRAMTHVFNKDNGGLPVQIGDAPAPLPEAPGSESVYNEEEQRAVEKRLEDLGYLE